MGIDRQLETALAIELFADQATDTLIVIGIRTQKARVQIEGLEAWA